MPIMIRRGDLNLTQIAALTFLLLPATARAMTLEFPGNTYLKAEQIEPVGSYAMPAGQWIQGNMAILEGEGEVTRQAWRIDASGLTTLQILTPLRDQLADQGFEVVFACETEGCGGFDFRFAQAVIPAHDMHVFIGHLVGHVVSTKSRSVRPIDVANQRGVSDCRSPGVRVEHPATDVPRGEVVDV